MKEDNLKWELVKSEYGEETTLFKVRFDFMKNPRNEKLVKTTVLESQDAVNVVAITKEKKILLVNQFRFGIGATTIEIPGGLVDKGEDHKIAGMRELREETGYTSSNWQYLGDCQSNPVFMDSLIHHWLALDVQKTETIELDDGEQIEVIELEKEELLNLIRTGEIKHPHTISALARIFNLWEPQLNI